MALRELTSQELGYVSGGLTFEEYIEMGVPEHIARLLAEEDASDETIAIPNYGSNPSGGGSTGTRVTGTRIPRDEPVEESN